MSTVALIDGDILCYECGFASDAAAKAAGMDKEPIEYCLNGVKMKIDHILSATEADTYTIFLTGKPPSGGLPYREIIFPEYKKNRDPTHRPQWYQEIKDYLTNHHNCIVCIDGLEADDWLGYVGCEERAVEGVTTVICSKDKDLDMIQGYHYNWSKSKIDKGVYYVSEMDGLKFFAEQMLTGDSTDNIPGIFKLFGKKATAKLKAPIATATNVSHLFEYVLQIYEDDMDLFLRNGELLWIRKDINESFRDFCSKI